jgi:capsular polysaccharide biosynthesis protein
MKAWLLRPPSQDDLIQVLQAWRVWLLATFIGALLGSIIYYVIPPTYRAQATVTVDHNLEQAWPDAEAERFLMTYLSRETQKVMQVAWDDATLQMVVDQNPGTSISSLRSGVLQLSQPSDGAWHFWADDLEASQAERLASAWASAFYERSLHGVDIATQLLVAQTALLQQPSDVSLSEKIQILEQESLGISPYLQLNLSQSEQIPVKRLNNSLISILGGAVTAWVITLLGLLFVGSRKENSGSR